MSKYVKYPSVVSDKISENIPLKIQAVFEGKTFVGYELSAGDKYWQKLKEDDSLRHNKISQGDNPLRYIDCNIELNCMPSLEDMDFGRVNHWTGLKITADFVRMGTGRILVCEYGEEYSLDECPFEPGDSLEYSDDNMEPQFFRITKIECISSMNNKVRNIFGLVVRKI